MFNAYFVLRDIHRIRSRIDGVTSTTDGFAGLRVLRECRRDAKSLVEHVYGESVDLTIRLSEVDIDDPIDYDSD